MSDLLIERMRRKSRELDDRAIAVRDYDDRTYLELSDLRELLEQAGVRIEAVHCSVHYLMGIRL